MSIFSKQALLVALFATAAALVSAVPIAQTHVHTVKEAPLPSDSATKLVDVSTTGNFNMFLTCDNKFDLFVNGVKVGSGSSWQTTFNFNADVANGDVIAIDGIDTGGPAAFIGVFNGVPTKPDDWRCKETTAPANWNTNAFDDSAWSKATSYGRNDGDNVWKSTAGGLSRPNIPADAQWLWTGDYNAHNRVFCRYKPTQSVRTVTLHSRL
jgi:hypothetical protein